ncbi:MAG: RdgB/HAM1 family non-canonical purine NTP pyrophosphatase [Gammaproteobacteria bacterium]|nr:RdgB/HAM1 family non-canonical purine NTP pyrophosphatase [Gammaproteobacteria bacterium]
MSRAVVLATRNNGKLREMQTLLAATGWTLTSLAETGIASLSEDAGTFIENALTKARHASQLSGMPSLADDSGLVVHALGGAPGVLSARFAGPAATDEQNNRRLLDALKDETNRRAAFVCVLVFLLRHDHPEPVIATGRWSGEILETPRGINGFGYDPLFLIPALGKTSAELEPEMKNRLSHRGLACRELLQKLRES